MCSVARPLRFYQYACERSAACRSTPVLARTRLRTLRALLATFYEIPKTIQYSIKPFKNSTHFNLTLKKTNARDPENLT